jgi:hypothetical protein
MRHAIAKLALLAGLCLAGAGVPASAAPTGLARPALSRHAFVYAPGRIRSPARIPAVYAALPGKSPLLITQNPAPPAATGKAGPAPTLPATDSSLGSLPDTAGGFVTSLCQGVSGQVWAGCEDTGLWRLDPRAPAGKQWTQFTTKDGLGDDNGYCIATDWLGRIWVGSQSHGVDVWNGNAWANYGVLEGPLGAHVFAIAICPTDGDVWMATGAGLTRYSLRRGRWSYYTGADGLPSDQAGALAFNKAGDIFVGAQCNGIAIARAKDNYKKWAVVRGPVRMPNTPGGSGLPTSLINCLLVSRAGAVYAGTTTGLARSEDDGKTWRYLRGADWKAKVLGLYHGPKPVDVDTHGHLLLEDYVTALAEDNAGLLWIGYRQKGLEVVDPATGKDVATYPDDYVTVLLPLPAGGMLVGHYGAGLSIRMTAVPPGTGTARAGTPHGARPVAGHSRSSYAQPRRSPRGTPAWLWTPGRLFTPGLPQPARPPGLSQLNAILTALNKVGVGHSPKNLGARGASRGAVASQGETPEIRVLDDDWATQGTWIDRYGRFACVLCAMGGGGNDYISGYRAIQFQRRGSIGENHPAGDCLRYWVHWLTTEDPRVLQNPIQGGRKEAEWDDHGEALPMAMDGPGVLCTVKLPPGRYVISAYFMNKDGHTNVNRYRDYIVEARFTILTPQQFGDLGLPGKSASAAFRDATPQERSRVTNFWGGVYKRFYVECPDGECVTLRVSRNGSLNTILQGVFVDWLGPLCGPLTPAELMALPGGAHRKTRAAPGQPAARPKATASAAAGTVGVERPTNLPDAALAVLSRLLTLKKTNPAWYAVYGRRPLMLVARALLAPVSPGVRLADEVDENEGDSQFRKNFAASLNDLQWFDRRDQADFSPLSFESYAWQELTALAEAHNWDYRLYRSLWHWSDAGYQSYVQERRAAEMWEVVPE